MEGKRKIVIILASVLLILGVIGLIVICVLYGIASQVGYMHAVVLDAGSTSTKLNLYHWKDDPFRTNGNVEQIADSKVKPGISNFVDKPFAAYESLKKPLQDLVANISKSELPQTPIYLAATAGMRLKLLEDPFGSTRLFEILRHGLLDSGLEVEIPNERIRMLSGSEEGLFGWVSVNHILGKITSTTQVTRAQTVGSLDLGGSSAQIAFATDVKPPTVEASVEMFPLRLYGHRYNVYSHSFLCYGKSMFELRTQGEIIGVQTTATINNPCLPNGYRSEDIIPTSIFTGPCMSGKFAKQVFGHELTKPTALNTFQFVGQGNPTACREAVNKQFDTVTCTNPPCSFNNVYQPEHNGAFRAYSGFSYVMSHIFPDKTTGFTKTEIETAVNSMCAKPWSELSVGVPVEQQGFIATYCFDGIYILRLLENYGFKTDEQWKQITFGTKIEGTTVSWALGYMLDQSGDLPSESPKVSLSKPLFIGLLVLMVAIIIVSIILLVLVLCSCICQ